MDIVTLTLAKKYANKKIAELAAVGFAPKIMDSLPTENINEHTLYLVPASDGISSNGYLEYIYINGGWECVGSTVIDFSMIGDVSQLTTEDKTTLVAAINEVFAKSATAINETKTYVNEQINNTTNYVNTKMAKMMAGDGEGATALLETKVIHAKTKKEAKILAKSVICSSLTKAAIFGHDANWGRILCALGYAGVEFDPENIELFFQGENGTIQIFKDGVACDYSEEEASKILAEPEVRILVDMKSGEEEACAWGCDLTYDYVKINADYRS